MSSILPTLAELDAMTDLDVRDMAVAHGFSFRSGLNHETPNEYFEARTVAARSFMAQQITAHPLTKLITPDELAASVDELKAEADRLRAALIAAQNARNEAQNTLNYERDQVERFKVEAGKIAMRYAKENDWCSVAKEALGEMGIPVPTTRKRFSVVIRMTVEATNNTTDDTDAYFLGRSEEISASGGELSWELDSDFEDVDIQDVAVSYQDIEDTDE